MAYVGCSECGLELKAAVIMVTPVDEALSKDIVGIWNTRSRPTVEAADAEMRAMVIVQEWADYAQTNGHYLAIHSYAENLIKRIAATISKPSVEAAETDFSEKFWEIVNGAIGDWGGAHDVITMTRRAAYREAYDLIAAEFAKSESMPVPAPVEAAEIRRQAFDEAIAIVRDKWLTVSVGKVRIENQSEYERTKVLAELEAARDAAPTPSKNSGDEKDV